MNGHQSWVGTLLPLVVLAGIMLLRLRNVAKARPLRPAALIALPALYAAIVGMTLVALPPSGMGWLCFAGGAVAGACIGWQRARLMRLHLDAETGQVMISQSPAALMLLVVVAGLRQLLRPAGAAPAAGHAAMPASALLFTDGLLGFALGMIVAQRVELWRRAKALRG